MIRSSRLAVFLSAVLSLIVTGASASPQVVFDQGIDVSSLTGELKKAVNASSHDESGFKAAFDRTERDCATFSFGKDDPLRSERVRLESRQYREVCHPRGRHGGMDCHEQWMGTERRSVRVEIKSRGEMLPWERDLITVCLDGSWLSAYVDDASHAYQLRTPGWEGDTVEAFATHKIASLPDPSGLRPAFGMDAVSGNFKIAFKDRWASYYGGETIAVKVKLRRHHKNWFDSTVLEKEFSFSTAESYQVRFADFSEELGKKLKEGKKYYVEYRFKRVGSVSKDKWTSKIETPKVHYRPAAALASLSEPMVFGKLSVCRLKAIEKDECVYSCSGGGEHRQPVSEPDPWDPNTPVIACPQIVIPF